MSKRNKEAETEVALEKPVEHDVVASEKSVVAVVEKESVNPLDKYTDEELYAFIEARRKAKSEAVAIKSVNVPMHQLIKTSATVVVHTPEEIAIQSRLRRLELQKMKESK